MACGTFPVSSIILLLAALPTWPYSAGWGYYPSGCLCTVLVIVLISVSGGRCHCGYAYPASFRPRFWSAAFRGVYALSVCGNKGSQRWFMPNKERIGGSVVSRIGVLPSLQDRRTR
ncbi:DUF3309 domain-containing protein [Labrys miyagiensis]|uniref:DUF3309 domain-containing protein n=1 Tax=Labrys miyagiensis TaxID=346912 RepID=UPI003D67516D